MDRKFFEKIKREEPWLMHLKDTWNPNGDVLRIEFQRASKYSPSNELGSWLDTMPNSDPPLRDDRGWVYAVGMNGTEKIRRLTGSPFTSVNSAISKVISVGDSVKRVAWHMIYGPLSKMAGIERIVVIKPPQINPLKSEPDLNRILNLECFFK